MPNTSSPDYRAGREDAIIEIHGMLEKMHRQCSTWQRKRATALFDAATAVYELGVALHKEREAHQHA